PTGSPCGAGLICPFAVRVHSYDGAGHPYFVSEWGGCPTLSADCGSLVPPGTTSSNFDPFGRAQRVTKADGTITTIDYTDGAIAFSDSFQKVTVNVSGVNSSTGTRKDALGRTLSVMEPDPVSGLLGSDVTSYSYNVLDKLACVKQGGAMDMTQCSTNLNGQLRQFVYDSFGFLRQETTPEKGANPVKYTQYDALGNVLSETESDQTTVRTRVFDTLGRPCKVTSGADFMLSFYDGATTCSTVTDPTTNPASGGGSFPKSKLTRRYGKN